MSRVTHRKSFTHRNHFQYGYGKQMVDFAAAQDFRVSSGPVSRQPLNPASEATLAAQMIFMENGKEKLTLCMSGGVDSEAMAIAFLNAKVPFEVAIMRFRPCFNYFDIKDAIQFCRRLSLPMKFYDLDICGFYNSGEFLEYARAYRFWHPELATHLWLAEKIGGGCVFAGAPPAIKADSSGEISLRFLNDNFYCYHRFFEKNGIFGVGHFFLYTPELIHAFIHLPIAQNFIFQVGEFKNRKFDYALKVQMYNDGGFPVAARPAKYVGLEKFKTWYHQEFGYNWYSHFKDMILKECGEPPFLADCNEAI